MGCRMHYRCLPWMAILLAMATARACASPPSPDLLDRWQTSGQPQMAASTARLNTAFNLPAIPTAPPSGSVKALVLLIAFPDKPGTRAPSDIAAMLFSTGSYPSGSMRDYFRENSYGRLDLPGDIAAHGSTGWFRAPQSYAYYTAGSYGQGSFPQNAQGLVRDALLQADQSVDFSQYDSNHDGIVDALFVIHAGSGAEVTGSPNDIWSHAGTLPALTLDGVQITSYAIEPEDGKIGIFCHEFGHLLGLPELYDSDKDSAGLGNWSVMASGCWGNGGATPAHFDAFCKTRLGWVTPATVGTSQLNATIPPVESNPAIYKLPAGDSASEYLLVENRQLTGFDAFLPGAGMLIYHVDESRPGNDDQTHYLVALEQADGLFDLESNRNRGDAGDPWPSWAGKTAFDNRSAPDSLSYSGGYRAKVCNIRASGTSMVADLWGDVRPTVPTSSIEPLPLNVGDSFPINYTAQCAEGIASVALYYDMGDGWTLYATDTTPGGATSYSGAIAFDAPRMGRARFVTIATSTGGTLEPLASGPYAALFSDDFESGSSAWSLRGAASLTESGFHSGTHSVMLGSTAAENYGDCWLARTVTLPPIASRIRLRSWLNRGTVDSINWDWQDVSVADDSGLPLATLLHTCATLGWTEMGFDLSPYAGRTIQIRYQVHGDSCFDPTWMQVDDVVLEASEPIEKASTTVVPFANILEPAWVFATGAPVRSSPSICDNTAYIGDDSGRIYALDTRTGSLLWNENCRISGASPESMIRTRVVRYQTPAGEERIYAGTQDGYLIAIDHQRARAWAACMGPWGVSTPAVTSTGLYVGCGRKVYRFHPETGARLGVSPDLGDVTESSPSVPDQDLVWIGANDGKLYCLSSDLSLVRTTRDLGPEPVKASPSVRTAPQARLAIGSSNANVLCLDPATFASLWGPVAVDGGIEGSGWDDGTDLYFGTTTGRIYGIDQATGAVAWVFCGTGSIRSSPVSIGGWVYLGTESGVFYAISTQDPSDYWAIQLPAPITSSPAATSDAGTGMVVVGCADGKVYGFRQR